jgi:monoamine oxidase
MPLRGQTQVQLKDLSFLFSSNPLFPTWWTLMPDQAPLLTGWSPGDRNLPLRAKPAAFAAGAAMAALSDLLAVDHSFLEKYLDSYYTYDWHSDPFVRGAYSHVAVGGENAQRELAEPVEDTLFFAGEATECQGHHGTVHGAMATGYRAAREIIGSLGR